MMKNNINQSLCRNCGLCAKVCPNRVIESNDSTAFNQEREHLCLQCGQCVAVCSVTSGILKLISGKEEFQTIKNHIYPIAKSGNYTHDYRDGITHGAPALITVHAAKDAEAHTNNGIIYATYMMLAAHALGLGATMIECIVAPINRNKKVKRIFRIPEENEAVMSLIVGHPKYRNKRTLKRNKHSVIMVD